MDSIELLQMDFNYFSKLILNFIARVLGDLTIEIL